MAWAELIWASCWYGEPSTLGGIRIERGDYVQCRVADWCEVFLREIDSDYSTPPAFPFRVLYSFQPRFHGFRLPDKNNS